jgi:hypothetical protein
MTTGNRVKSLVMNLSASFDIVSFGFGGKEKKDDVWEYLDGGDGDDADGTRVET